ncbi:hypothetical protein CCR94_16225 [Rhodoblastus sphagnicola]|uniref:Phage tail protein n=1 Tax=Rhodoblastus sphagnicola TaxID=333368 RepID=A0A2S6N2W6_9HYPH|nr:phage tail protein [Rhodoblastus sphagnicola]MBB4199039.1 hypothetical protein [Rhodoblastus sphagnicola]PPQ28936.1 hypothetical protein CCR94_16225 [Rhodoblastus sphagnicola]
MSLLIWGDYSFNAGAASFEELTHKWAGRWSKPPVFGRRPPGQYLGPAEEDLTVKGTIYPAAMDGDPFGQIVAMQQAAGAGAVDMLFSGGGDAFGLFRLEEVEYRASSHLPDGRPQKVEYTLKFSAADDFGGGIFAFWPA